MQSHFWERHEAFRYSAQAVLAVNEPFKCAMRKERNVNATVFHTDVGAKDYNHTLTTRMRRLFLEGRADEITGVSPDILDSWQRCVELHLDPQSQVATPHGTPLITDQQAITEQLPAIHKFSRREFYGPIYDDFIDFLKSIHAVFFTALEDMTIFAQRGDPELLQALNDRNFGVGGNLGEQWVGTTAAALSRKQRVPALVIGAEHYHDMFQPYATYAFLGADSYAKYYMLIVMPREIVSSTLFKTFDYFHTARVAICESFRSATSLSMKNELYNEVLKSRNEAIIFVDYYKRIISVNAVFSRWFELAEDDVVNHELTELLPELRFCLSSLKTGKPIQLKELYFEELPANLCHLHMKCDPWMRDGIICGLIITLMDSRHIKNMVTTLSKSRAYYTFDDLIGESEIFIEAKNIALTAAKSTSAVIIIGETGTGKELFAQSIHNASQRRNEPFVAVNCSAIPRELIGNELFGHVDGAFTGARKGGSIGKFEFANGGTLFLDEIAELPLDIQAVLLRVLEERAISRIGSNAVTPVDVRVISATNKNLLDMVEEGKFRLDLYYRLNVMTLKLPSLSGRKDDLALLIRHILTSLNVAFRKNVHHIDPEALHLLTAYDWPGNIRQLRNVLERGVNVAAGDTLRPADLPEELLNQTPAVAHAPSAEEAPEDASARHYEQWERDMIWGLMRKHRDNKLKIAAELGISRGTLYRKLAKYGL